MKYKYKQLLVTTVGAGVLVSALAIKNLDVYAAATQVADLTELNSCLAISGKWCALSADIVPTEASVVSIASGNAVKLDLQGHTLGNPDSINDLRINVEGRLAIVDAAGGSGKIYAPINIDTSASDVVQIETGKYYGEIVVGSGILAVEGGTFYQNILGTADSELRLHGGIFEGAIESGSSRDVTISGGTYNGNLAIHGYGNKKISGGTFNGDVLALIGTYVEETPARVLEIGDSTARSSAPVFNGSVNVNAGDYTGTELATVPGTRLTVVAGTFNNGLDVNVETLQVTGGTFNNTSENPALKLRWGNQNNSYSITGGSLNNVDSNSTLVQVLSTLALTEDDIRGFFAGGSVLDGITIIPGTESVDGVFVSSLNAGTEEPNPDDDNNDDDNNDDEDNNDDNNDDGGDNEDNDGGNDNEDGGNDDNAEEGGDDGNDEENNDGEDGDGDDKDDDGKGPDSVTAGDGSVGATKPGTTGGSSDDTAAGAATGASIKAPDTGANHQNELDFSMTSTQIIVFTAITISVAAGLVLYFASRNGMSFRKKK